jgi:hypothetical protein
MKQRYWQIRGYNGATKIFEKEVHVSHFSENQIKCLLKALAAKAGLEFDEIVGAYARKKSKISNDLLLVNKDGPYPVYICGANPHFVAKVITRDDL